jgi:hypothetical protein
MQIELKLIFYSILEYNEFYKVHWFLGPTQEHNLDIGSKQKEQHALHM